MLYWLGRTLFYIFFKVVHRFRAEHLERVPTGGFILAPNHESYFDPPFAGSALPRGVYFMAKKELFEIPVLGYLIKRTHAFPVDREKPGPSSIKTSLKLLKDNRIVLVFPEGTRKSRIPMPGVGILAHKSQKPVLPVRIKKDDKGHMVFVAGDPVYFPQPKSRKVPTQEYTAFSQQIIDKIYQL